MIFSATSTRVRRLIRLISILNTGSMHNTLDLAAALEVSRRTVFRDIQFLRDAGLTIIFDERQNAFILPQGHPISTHFISRDELALLVLAIKSSPIQRSPRIAVSLGGALAKLLASRPESEAEELKFLSLNCLLEHDDAVARDVHPEVLSIVLQGLMSKRLIRVQLAGPDRDQPDLVVLAPYRVVCNGSCWKVIGRGSDDDRTTAFDLSAIVAAELTDVSFAPPPLPHGRFTARKGQRGTV